MRNVELMKRGDRSLVARLRDDNTVSEYVTCTDFNPDKPDGSQWCWGHYFGTNLEHAVEDLDGGIHSMLMKMGYDAVKLWCEDDIKCYLAENGYPATEHNIQEMYDHLWLDGLEECTDRDWQIFKDALNGAEANLEDA